MDKFYTLIFKTFKKVILKEFTIQVLYLFVLLELIPFFVNVEHYNSFILLILFVVLYNISCIVKKFIRKHPKLTLIISLMLLVALLINLGFGRYEISKYINSQRFAILSNNFEFWTILPYVVVIMLLIIISYFTFLNKVYFFITPAACLILITLTWYTVAEGKYKNILILFLFTFFIDMLLYIYNTNKRKGARGKLYFGVDIKIIIKYGFAIITMMLIFCIAISNILGTKSLDEIRRDEIMKKMNNLNAPLFNSLNSKLGGSVNLSDKVLFKIKGDTPNYLIGSIKDNYSGTSWNNSYTQYNKARSPFSKNKTYKSLMGETNNRKLKIKSMEIIPEAAPWKTLFVPNNIYSITTKSRDIAFNRNYCFVNLSKNNSEPYYVDYYQSYNNIETIESSKQNYISYDINSDKIRTKYSDYLQLPDNISQRTRNLVSDITKNCKNNTEKVMAIKGYLSNTYAYTTEVENLPSGKEFVDYFLFEEKKGYCTYFATACTVMLRIAGIPARYAEGYYVDKTNFKDGYYNILENDGHAFAEVLVSPDADLWSIVESTSIIGAQNHGNIPPYAIYYQNKYQINAGNNINYQRNAGQSNNKDAKNSKLFYVYTILFSVLIFLVAALIILIILINIKKKKIIHSDSIIPLYYYIRCRLIAAGYMTNSNETDYEQIAKIYDSEIKELVKPLLECYYREFYGEEKTKIDKKIVLAEFEKYMRKKHGNLIYFRTRAKGIFVLKKRTRVLNAKK